MSQHIILHLIIFFQMLESLETIIRKKKTKLLLAFRLYKMEEGPDLAHGLPSLLLK